MATNGQINIPLAVVGYDFRRASAGWRARLILKTDEQEELARRLDQGGMLNGLAVLNTCNRNEWIASTETPDWTAQILRAQMIRILQERSGQEKVPEPYTFVGSAAARHLLHVTAGLESFVIGERQIATQVHCAFNVARQFKRSSVILNGLGSVCGRATRDTKHIQLADLSLRGVHDAAVRYLSQKLDPQSSAAVLIVGYGAIGRQVAQSLRVRTKWALTVANRSINPLARDAIEPLDRLPELLARADAVVVCSGAFEPLITPAMIAARPSDHPLEVVDLGIPLQVESAVGKLDGVTLTDLDRLQSTIWLKARDIEKVRQVEDILDGLLNEFERFCRERDLVTVLQAAQDQHERTIHDIIPAVIAEELPNLTEEQRRRLTFRLRGAVRDYTNAIFDSIHQTSEKPNDE